MPGAEERTILNFVQMLMQGIDLNDNQKSVLLQADRSLAVWSKLVGTDGTRERIVQVSPDGHIRVRPYEPILPVEGITLTGVTTTVHTSTASRQRCYIELVNNDGIATNTATVTIQNLTTGLAVCVATEIPPGIGTRLGHYDLDAGWFIEGLSSPANSVDIHVIVDRYNETGDTA